ncbi:hypothetical protein NPA07_02460 [Mycoplasmopsis caviae]|uniref:Uncharacterized protein n=1 Tax=Mycoplasmopsis caviae TaxID=55603 RepID=A0A3P8MED6_9BACT|nr:hypothetical protein [Mycoplasmopsis caviae]UUD35714.1 hypothetical protein NPA07_02460 [Mycoplasmopsis caviae]VDR41546.1 Uncharacterised protein [Mycoplasmopsis caviae]
MNRKNKLKLILSNLGFVSLLAPMVSSSCGSGPKTPPAPTPNPGTTPTPAPTPNPGTTPTPTPTPTPNPNPGTTPGQPNQPSNPPVQNEISVEEDMNISIHKKTHYSFKQSINYIASEKVYRVINSNNLKSDEISKADLIITSKSGKYTYTIDTLTSSKEKGEIDLVIDRQKDGKNVKHNIKIKGFYTDLFDKKLYLINSLDLKDKTQYIVKQYIRKFKTLDELKSQLSIKTSNNMDLSAFLTAQDLNIKNISVDEVDNLKGECIVTITFLENSTGKSQELSYVVNGFKQTQRLEDAVNSIFDKIELQDNINDFTIYDYGINDANNMPKFYKNNTEVTNIKDIFTQKGINFKNTRIMQSSKQTDGYKGSAMVFLAFGWIDSSNSEVYAYQQQVIGFKKLKTDTELKDVLKNVSTLTL